MMGILNFFKKYLKEPEVSNKNEGLPNEYKLYQERFRPEWIDEYLKHENLAEENKYINDYKAQKHFNIAYEFAKDSVMYRYQILNKMIDYYYGLRDQQEDALDKCIELCKECISIAPEIITEYEYDHYEVFKYDTEFIPPNIPAFKRLAIIYENQKKYEEAIKICKGALSLGLKDGTKTGYEGRIERLKKKMQKMEG